MTAHLFGINETDVATTTDDWYTPRWIFDAADVRFDMDVAAPVNPKMRTCPADEFLTVVEDGLTTPWRGVVWCNPPYSRADPWVRKWADHDSGMILLAARTEVHWRGVVMGASDAMTLISANFHRPDGSIARLQWPLILAARGEVCVDALIRVASADIHARGAYLVRPA